ncbi:MAG TPA: DUF4350 domain-containing protein [Alphaproteobacteria bacterium]|nr:DUF4350 domain-containing protein [Alphaproteobacteria bacterium]
MSLAKSDRRLLMWGGIILVPIIVVLALASDDQNDSGIPSSYSHQSRGAKAAYLLLQEEGYKVQRWEQTPSELPAEAANTVLVMALPLKPPTKEEKEALLQYLNHGGRVIITGSTVANYLPKAKIDFESAPSPEWKDFQPRLLTGLTRGGAIQMSPGAYWDSSSTEVLVHYADEDRPIVVSYPLGAGQVIWWASSIPLSNAGISRSGNLALLLNSLGNSKNSEIFWDEYFHGSQSSLGAYMAEPPIAWALVQCGLIAVALLLTYSRRTGPIHPWYQPSRLSPLEFIYTLGNLYRRARATDSAVEIPYKRFRSLVTRQLGLRPDLSAEDLARTIKNRLGYKQDGLEETLREIESSRYDPSLTEARALELVQQLSRHAYNLKLIAQEPQEAYSHAERVPGARPRAH